MAITLLLLTTREVVRINLQGVGFRPKRKKKHYKELARNRFENDVELETRKNRQVIWYFKSAQLILLYE